MPAGGMITGNIYGVPHFKFIDTKSQPDFEDTMPSMPAPFYGTATGRHRYLPPPKVRGWRMFFLSFAVVLLCALPAILYTI